MRGRSRATAPTPAACCSTTSGSPTRSAGGRRATCSPTCSPRPSRAGPDRRGDMTDRDLDSITEDAEFDLLVDNAAELGLGWSGPPAVRRVATVVAGREVSALQW